MRDGRGTTLLGGLALPLCPLVCVGLPLLVAAGIGTGLALAIGGVVLGGVVLVGLGVGALLVLHRWSRPEACCPPTE